MRGAPVKGNRSTWRVLIVAFGHTHPCDRMTAHIYRANTERVKKVWAVRKTRHAQRAAQPYLRKIGLFGLGIGVIIGDAGSGCGSYLPSYLIGNIVHFRKISPFPHLS